jgi:hypothetical protein
MRDYSRSKLYYIIDKTNGDKYVGSTIEKIWRRKAKHKDAYIQYCKNNASWCASFNIIKNGNYEIELIEDYPCENDEQLRIREQFWIDTIDCINIRRAYASEEYKLIQKRISDKKHYDYYITWGGNKTNNNLLKIETDLFI